MQIAQVMGGYSLGEADVLRRAMGKKDKAAMAQQQAEFVRRAVEKGVKKSDAAFIFEHVDKFAGYGFNKSHAAAYALVSYHTAYLKANYREEFLAASMTLDMANTDKLAVFAAEAKRSDIELKPPCVNGSDVEFLSEPPSNGSDHGAIRYALASLKNIGVAAVETVVREREANGIYEDLSDFARRLPSKTLNKRNIETLASAGSFDGLEPNRAVVHRNAEQILALSNRMSANAASGIQDLFGGAGGEAPASLDMRPTKSWTPMERLEKEFDAIGFYLSGHPLNEYDSVLESMGVQTFAGFEAGVEQGRLGGRIAAIVVSARERKSAKGNAFAFAMFSDTTGQFEAVIFSDTLNASRHLLEPGTPVVVGIEAEYDGETIKMRVQGIESLNSAAGAVRCPLRITLDGHALSNGKSETLLAELRESLKPGRDEIRLIVDVADRSQVCELVLPGRYDTTPPSRGILSAIDGVVTVDEVAA